MLFELHNEYRNFCVLINTPWLHLRLTLDFINIDFSNLNFSDKNLNSLQTDIKSFAANIFSQDILKNLRPVQDRLIRTQ